MSAKCSIPCTRCIVEDVSKRTLELVGLHRVALCFFNWHWLQLAFFLDFAVSSSCCLVAVVVVVVVGLSGAGASGGVFIVVVCCLLLVDVGRPRPVATLLWCLQWFPHEIVQFNHADIPQLQGPFQNQLA